MYRRGPRVRLLAGAALLALLAGCGGAGVSSQSPGTSAVAAVPTTAGEPTPRATANEHREATPTVPPSDGYQHEVPDLEALLPDSVNGLALIKSSRHGTGNESSVIVDMVTAAGRSLADLDLATAAINNVDATFAGAILEVRVRGADANQMRTNFIREVQQEPDATNPPESPRRGKVPRQRRSRRPLRR